MKNKTPSYRLKANANYHSKTTQKIVRFRNDKDADLLQAISDDEQSLTGLVRQLLREHYKLKNSR